MNFSFNLCVVFKQFFVKFLLKTWLYCDVSIYHTDFCIILVYVMYMCCCFIDIDFLWLLTSFASTNIMHLTNGVLQWLLQKVQETTGMHNSNINYVRSEIVL